MKKTKTLRIVSMLLCLILLFSLVGCGAGKQKKEIELTGENIKDYLSISLEYTGQRKPTIISSLSDYTVLLKVYPVQDVSFNNVELILHFSLGTSSYSKWEVPQSDPAYLYSSEVTNKDGFPNYLVTKIVLPSDGHYEETHVLRGLSIYANDFPQSFSFTPKSGENSVYHFMASDAIPEGTPMYKGTVVLD